MEPCPTYLQIVKDNTTNSRTFPLWSLVWCNIAFLQESEFLDSFFNITHKKALQCGKSINKCSTCAKNVSAIVHLKTTNTASPLQHSMLSVANHVLIVFILLINGGSKIKKVIENKIFFYRNSFQPSVVTKDCVMHSDDLSQFWSWGLVGWTLRRKYNQVNMIIGSSDSWPLLSKRTTEWYHWAID